MHSLVAVSDRRSPNRDETMPVPGFACACRFQGPGRWNHSPISSRLQRSDSFSRAFSFSVLRHSESYHCQPLAFRPRFQVLAPRIAYCVVIVAVVRPQYKPLVPLRLAGISSGSWDGEQESILMPVAAVLLLHMLRLQSWLAEIISGTQGPK